MRHVLFIPDYPHVPYRHHFTFDAAQQAVLFDERPMALFPELQQICLEQQGKFPGHPAATFALKLDYREGPHTVICCNRDRPALLRTGLAIAEVTGLPLVERWQAGSPDDDGAFPDDGDASMISFRLDGTDASGSTSGGFRNPDGKWDAGMFPDRDGGADFDSGQDGGGDSDGGGD